MSVCRPQEVLEAGPGAGPALPAARVVPTTGDLLWLLDGPAAADLTITVETPTTVMVTRVTRVRVTMETARVNTVGLCTRPASPMAAWSPAATRQRAAMTSCCCSASASR